MSASTVAAVSSPATAPAVVSTPAPSGSSIAGTIPVISPDPATYSTGPNNSIHVLPNPAWNGTVKKGEWVCTTPNNTVTVACCSQLNGTRQVHDLDFFKGVEMCLSTANFTVWAGCASQSKYYAPDNYGSACTPGSGASRTKSVSVAVVVAVVASVALSVLSAA